VRYAKLQTEHLEQHSFMSLPLSLQQQCVIKLYLAAKFIRGIHSENEISTGSKITFVSQLICSLKRKKEVALRIAFI